MTKPLKSLVELLCDMSQIDTYIGSRPWPRTIQAVEQIVQSGSWLVLGPIVSAWVAIEDRPAVYREFTERITRELIS